MYVDQDSVQTKISGLIWKKSDDEMTLKLLSWSQTITLNFLLQMKERLSIIYLPKWTIFSII